ncbi:MAG: hypothetical protein AAF382_17390 [Pseudomonadota bacterium]
MDKVYHAAQAHGGAMTGKEDDTRTGHPATVKRLNHGRFWQGGGASTRKTLTFLRVDQNLTWF